MLVMATVTSQKMTHVVVKILAATRINTVASIVGIVMIYFSETNFPSSFRSASSELFPLFLSLDSNLTYTSNLR